MATYSIYNPITKTREHLENREEERDLGVIIDDKLKFHSHVQHVVSRANSSLGLLKRTISSREATIFIKLYKALVRPHLDFGMCLAGPSYRQDVRLIENVQRRATKCVKSLKSTSYEDRLKQLKLSTLVYRRMRSDMMLTYKLREENSTIFSSSHSTSHHYTRGHSKKLPKLSSRSRTRQMYFSRRVINHWNQLKDSTVSAPSIQSFKCHLDKEWEKRQWRFNWESSTQEHYRSGGP
jgi:hypothetical protein